MIMKVCRQPFLSRAFFAILFLAFASGASAQDQPLESRLPANTTFYVSWHGAKPLAAARASNGVLRLWDDPDVGAARAAMITQIFSDTPKDKIVMSREEVTSLLENPFIFAGILKPGATSAAAGATAKKGPDVDFMMIYDRTGREELIGRLMKLESSATPPPTITAMTLRGVQVETVAGPKSTHYRALAGSYVIYSDNRELLGEMIGRLGAPVVAAESVVGTAAHRSAFSESKPGDALTFFFNFSGMLKTVMAGQGGQSGEAVIKSMHLDRLESMSSTLSFEETKTHVRMSILGDLSAGGVTDIIGPGAPNFVTMAAVPASATGFNCIRLDLSAFYRIVRQAVGAAAKPGQPNPVDSAESAVSTQLGMTLPEMMQLLSGEFASVDLEPGLDFSEKMFMLAIDKPDDILHLLRAMMTDSIKNEDSDGPVTYLAILSPLTTKTAGKAAPSRKFWYVGVGPHLLVVAPRKAMARETMARFQSADHSGSLAADPRFLAVRGRLPRNLSGLSYADVSRTDWAKLQKQLQEMSDTATSQAAADPATPPAQQEKMKKFMEGWKLMPLQAISKYLHSSYGGWWKDQRGVYFDSYIE
jgi:hypothetical protein